MLHELIAESSDYEFKEQLEMKKPKSWLKTISSFANTIGGTIFFGVSNDKKIVGLENPQYISEQISEKINAKIKPTPIYVLSSFLEDNKIVVAVKVSAGISTPYFYESDGIREAYIRSGNQSTIAPGHILNELILKGTNQTFDTISTVYKKINYSFSFFEATFYKMTNTRLTEEDYISFGLVEKSGLLTNGGALFADQTIYRHSCIFCTHWNGFDKAPLNEEAIDDKEYSGSIVKLLFSALDFIKSNTKKKWKKEVLQTIEMPDYDELAIREAIVNALIHREYTRNGSEITVNLYKNRLEITSPGEIFSGKLIEKRINHPVSSERRNPVIADVFSRMKFMDRRGSGLKKISQRTNALFNDNGDHVEFYSKDGFFKVVIFNANYRNEPINKQTNLSKNAEIILAEIKKDRSISQLQLSIKLNISLATIKRGLKELVEANILLGKSTKKGGKWIIK